MAPPRQPKFSFRTDSPFDAQQSAFIILKYGELKNVALVRRAFGTKFYPRHPRMLPHRGQFKRVIDQFLESGSVRPTVPVGHVRQAAGHRAWPMWSGANPPPLSS